MAKKIGGLGRGLDALFANAEPIRERDSDNNEAVEKGKKAAAKETRRPKASEETILDENRISYIDINEIKPNKDQPRKSFDEEKLAERAKSIIENGVIQPIVVRKAKSGYELVAGERRWRAARIAGLSIVPCIVREFTDEQNMMIAIIENMQREDLNPVEEAEGLSRMMKRLGMTQDEVSRAVGKSRAYIANSVRLLKLPEEIKNMMVEGALSAAHGRALAGMGDDGKRLRLAERIRRDGLSVRETERLASDEKRGAKPAARKKREKSEDILAVEEELRRITGTKVNIIRDRSTQKYSGKVELEYYSLEELNRLIDLLRTIE